MGAARPVNGYRPETQTATRLRPWPFGSAGSMPELIPEGLARGFRAVDQPFQAASAICFLQTARIQIWML
jgi:hypothetical protein